MKQNNISLFLSIQKQRILNNCKHWIDLTSLSFTKIDNDPYIQDLTYKCSHTDCKKKHLKFIVQTDYKINGSLQLLDYNPNFIKLGKNQYKEKINGNILSCIIEFENQINEEQYAIILNKFEENWKDYCIQMNTFIPQINLEMHSFLTDLKNNKEQESEYIKNQKNKLKK